MLRIPYLDAEEIGVSCVHVSSKVLSARGKKQIWESTSGKMGHNVTVFRMSATEQFIPNLFIFSSKNESETDVKWIC